MKLNFEQVGNYGEVQDGRLFGPKGGVVEAAGLTGDWARAQRERSLAHRMRVTDAARLYADCLSGRVDPIFIREATNPSNEVLVHWLMENYGNIYRDSNGRTLGLRETMSVTDYQALFVDVLDRMYYGFYNAYPIVNKAMVRAHNLRDFRIVSRYLLDGVVSPLDVVEGGGDPAALWRQRALSGPVPQDGATYPTTNTAPIQYQPKLYQAGTSVNWRAFVNDDLGIFKDLSERLAIAGNRGISKFITSMYVDANGPNANLYKSGYNNQILIANGASKDNPALTVQGLIDGFNVLARMKDSGGDPIMTVGKKYLWYGSAYYGTVQNILHELSVFVQNQGGTGNTQGFPVQFLQVDNWVAKDVQPIFDPYTNIVCTASGVKDTQWGIMLDPGAQNRPAIEVGWLNGFETPQIFTKVPNTMRLGGGVDAIMGDFYSMDQEMKIMTVMGGTQIDGRSTVASTGAGG